MALIELTLSWPLIYFIMALPAILMLANFVFGSCTVSDFVDQMSGKNDRALDLTPERLQELSRRRRNGKLVITFMFSLFTVEPFAYLGFIRNGRCNVGGLIFFGRAIVECGWLEATFFATWTLKYILFIANVLSNPSTGSETAQQQSKHTHHCRTCNVPVPGHDHHCIFINNCVGSANYSLFQTFLLVSVINTHLVFFSTVGDMFTRGTPIEMALAVTSYTFFFGLVALFTFHVLIWRKGVTTSQFLKSKRGTWERVSFLLS